MNGIVLQKVTFRLRVYTSNFIFNKNLSSLQLESPNGSSFFGPEVSLKI